MHFFSKTLPINKAWVLLLPLSVKAPQVITISILYCCKVVLTFIILSILSALGSLFR